MDMDDNDLLSLLNPQKEEERTAQRRERRRARLERAKQDAAADQKEIPQPKKAKVAEIDPKQRLNNNSYKNAEDQVTTSPEEHVEEDMFDMFSGAISPDEASASAGKSVGVSNTAQGGDRQDSDGYYKAVIGEAIQLNKDSTYTVLGVMGKGVFSTVLKCSVGTTSAASRSKDNHKQQVVALKMIRSNERMAKAAIIEIEMLKRLQQAPGVLKLLDHYPDHHGQVVLVLTWWPYNLRQVAKSGLEFNVILSYFGQLLQALAHLQHHQIIHADIKPDNILVHQNQVVLADFGSSMDNANNPDATTTYLVSRFYRAPEIMLGLKVSYAIDLWSLTISMAEAYLGELVFQGSSNNAILARYMEQLGPIPNRVIRQHLLSCATTNNRQYFVKEGPQYSFVQDSIDVVTQRPVVQKRPLTAFPGKQSLSKRLVAGMSGRKVRLLADLVLKCLDLDASRRITLKDALQHEVFSTP